MLKKRIPLIGLLFPVLPLISPSARSLSESMKVHAALTLEKVRKRIEMGDEKQDDFFFHALKTGNLSELELAAEANTIITAGAETTATALDAAIWYLSQPTTAGGLSPLTKLQREVRGHFKSYADITGDAAAKLPYLNAVLEEAMRIFPPIAQGMERISPGETVDGHYIPAGIYVAGHTLFIQHDERNTLSASKFEPERWLGARAKDARPFSVPFSIGPRSCLGINLAYLEMRITLAKLVYRYDWTLTHNPGFDWASECRYFMMWQKAELRAIFRPASGI